jgi:putative FmdB family regulatory protein
MHWPVLTFHMPIYEYECRACRHQFEAIVRLGETSACPDCRSPDLERLISLFAVDSADSRRMSRDAARRVHARTTKDKAHAEAEYERKHEH